MSETFEDEFQNEKPTVIHSMDRVLAEAAKVDAQHEANLALATQNEELRRKIAVYEKPVDIVVNSIGGDPVPHHLHLVDGRVIPNHSGIGTHYTEVINVGGDLVTKVTRVAAHYPANEVDPTKKYA